MMKSAIGAIILSVGLAGCAGKMDASRDANAAASADQAPVMQASANKNVCLQTYLIDHTQVTDDSTILFFMRGRDVWKNSLPYPCFGLKMSGGFQYETSINEICSNLQTVRVIEQGGGPRLGATCMLGAFTPYTPAPAARS